MIDPKSSLVPELACRDVAVSKAFYTEVLGFSVLYERLEQGFYYLERQGVEIMIEQLSDSSWINGPVEQSFGLGLHFQIMTNGLADLYAVCQSKHAVIYREWEETWYRVDQHYLGQSQFMVCDPDGYMLRFAEDLGRLEQPPAVGRVVN